MQIARARRGDAELLLTSVRPAPASWYQPVKGRRILCLACGGGQQAPLLAAMGAQVTLLDVSESQLAHDAMVAQREGLNLDIHQGSMTDLSRFADASFDLIFHPISNCYIPDPQPVWEECYRVLAAGGELLSGCINPILYLFDMDAFERGELLVANTIRYSDLAQLPAEQLEERIRRQDTIEFGHSLESLIRGQMQAGFVHTDFYEDHCGHKGLDQYIMSNFATRALKLLIHQRDA